MTRSNAQAHGKRILIMAAGTGGHVYPALTTAAMLQQHDWKVEWLGTGKGIKRGWFQMQAYDYIVWMWSV